MEWSEMKNMRMKKNRELEATSIDEVCQRISCDERGAAMFSRRWPGVREMTQEKNEEKLKLPVHPLGENRPWIKLWVAPWLDGTTRYEMSGSQRAFWIDLLAQGARSRIAGVISPGQVNGKLLGYPLTWFQGFQPDIDVVATLELFQSTGKIERVNDGDRIAVKILNWDKYQPPLNGAERIKKWRRKKKAAGV
jgi:hypothetical protein